jgi:hypothetical protein
MGDFIYKGNSSDPEDTDEVEGQIIRFNFNLFN